jgi:histidine ammonia-lyase
MTTTMQIEPGQFTLDQLQAIHSGVQKLTIPEASRAIIRASQQVVQRAADGDVPVYGVNTGFG